MKVGIIGAGTMGLTLAYRLSAAGHDVVVLEASPQIGGLGTWFDYGDFIWDKYYHVILQQDSHLLGLIEELGLSSELRWGETRTGFLWKGRLISMSNNWEFLTFPALRFLEKMRLAIGILYVQRIRDPSRLERTKATEWMKRIFGTRVYQAIWEPLLESKYGALKAEMPATLMWATIRRYYSTRSRSGGRERMGFLSLGFKSLYEAIEQRIMKQGGRIHCSTAATRVDDSRASAVLVHTVRGPFEVDRLISTAPSESLCRIAPEESDLLVDNARRPRYLGVVCLSLVLRRPLNPYYVTNLIQKGFPFTGVIGISNLTGTQKFAGHSLVMLPRYELPESEWFEKSAETIAAEFLAGLRVFSPDVENNLVRCYMNRERLVQALWVSNPPGDARPRRSRTGRVWNINAELAGRDTLNSNAVVKTANKAAVEFLSSSAAAADPSLAPGRDLARSFAVAHHN